MNEKMKLFKTVKKMMIIMGMMTMKAMVGSGKVKIRIVTSIIHQMRRVVRRSKRR